MNLKVPKDFQKNLQFRLELRERARRDVGLQRELRHICQEDFLFFLNAFAWLYEPRPRFDKKGNRLPKEIPFITWPHQDPVAVVLDQLLGREDIGLKKSRGEGASWMAIWKALKDWTFETLSTIAMVSRSKEAVYNGKDPNSLFWKLDWGRKRLPIWMVGVEDKENGWERNLSENTLINNAMQNVIIGYAATGKAGSGARTDWFLLDELSKFPRPQDAEVMESILSVTDSRLVVGTPLGAVGAYYEIMHSKSSIQILTLHWVDNPTKNRGLYRMQHGKIIPVDPFNNPLPAEYRDDNPKIQELFRVLKGRGYNLEKGPRSPWYDKQCMRASSTPQSIAQELDMDFSGSSRQYFGYEFLEEIAKTTKDPILRGNIRTEPGKSGVFWSSEESGTALLWVPLDDQGDPPIGEYVVACDLSSGSGGVSTSNSVLFVMNANTKEQVFEYAINNIMQPDFAELAINVARWFHDAKLGWEGNNATAFTEKVFGSDYKNLYLRPILFKNRRRQSTRSEISWWTSEKTKPVMFADFEHAVRMKQVAIRSYSIREEAAQYIYDDVGRIEFNGHINDKNHGDRVIAACVALQMLKEHIVKPVGSVEAQYVGTMEWRDRLYSEEDQEDDGWDHSVPAELVGFTGFGMKTASEEFGWE